MSDHYRLAGGSNRRLCKTSIRRREPRYADESDDVSQINPFRAVVLPSARPQAVQVHKDRQQRQGAQQEGKGTADEQPPEQQPPQQQPTPDDGKPHLDVKA